MSPFLFAYPIDNDDIKTMLRYAKTINKKVVARSGGHQYSGLSSGGDGTIVISMNNFNCISENAKNWIEIGPCVSLKRLSDYL
jgi:FAD/FMN-containing dehydrogenase